MKTEPGKKLMLMKPYRRVVQVLVLAALILIPYGSMNPGEWAPSRIVQGHIPSPRLLHVSGDTWNVEIYGLSFSHPLAFLDSWLSSHVIYLPILLAALIPLGLTLLLGRVFCSWLCPVGFLLELNMKIRKLVAGLGIRTDFSLPDMRYHILALCLFLAFFLAIPILSVLDPPHIFGRELMNLFTHNTVSVIGITLLLGIVIADTFLESRLCCSKICPSGGGLALLGKYRQLRIRLDRDKCIECGQCDASCPYDLAPMELAFDRRFNWTKCDNCGLCRDSCPTGAITYSLGKTIKNTEK